MLHGWKDNSMLANPSQHIPIYLQYFPSYTMLIFFTTFWFPLGTPLGQSCKMLYGWKENSMLTNCLVACAHLSITVCKIEQDICEKNPHFIIPLAFDAPVRGVPVGMSAPPLVWKTRMVSLPDGEKIVKICLFVLTWSTSAFTLFFLFVSVSFSVFLTWSLNIYYVS